MISVRSAARTDAAPAAEVELPHHADGAVRSLHVEEDRRRERGGGWCGRPEGGDPESAGQPADAPPDGGRRRHADGHRAQRRLRYDAQPVVSAPLFSAVF